MTDIDTNVHVVTSSEITSKISDNHSNSLFKYTRSILFAEVAAGTASSPTFLSDGNSITNTKPGFRPEQAPRPTSTSSPRLNPSINEPTITDTIITPFLYTPSCTSLPSFCGVGVPTGILCIQRSDPTWQNCQPTIGKEHSIYRDFYPDSGRNTELRHVYSKAVCPAGWVALDLGLKYKTLATMTSTGVSWTRAYTSTLLFSTAGCSQESDRLGHDSWGLYSPGPTVLGNDARQTWRPVCVGYWGMGKHPMTNRFFHDRRSGRNEELALTTVTRVYPAWYIEWQSEDLEGLSPRWPELTSNMLVPTWSEGVVLESGKFDNRGRLSYRPAAPTTPVISYNVSDEGEKGTSIVIILSVILTSSIGLPIALLVWCCYRQNRKAKDEKERGRTGTCQRDRLKEKKGRK